MKVLCDRRDQRVVERPAAPLGEVVFRPGGTTREPRAEMSTDTWNLISNNDDIGRSYTIARSRAMRQRTSSQMNLISSGDRTKVDALAGLEKDVSALLSAMHAVTDPSEYTAGDLLRRRQLLRNELAIVRSRVEAVGAKFEVIDELLEAKVLS